MSSDSVPENIAPGFEHGNWWDAGHGVRMRLWKHDGEPDSLEYTHNCGERGQRRDHIPLAPCWKTGWKILKLEPLTLAPSLLCLSCGFHGFVREGKWVPA